MRRLEVVLLVATFATINAVSAQNYPNAYESSYETNMEGLGTQKIHYLSDGKGHVRTETTDVLGQTSLVLMDYPQHTLTTTLDINGQKRFMKTALPDYTGPAPFKQDAKDLGAKVIDGHSCHGYEKTYPNGQTSDIWVEDKTDCTILTESVGVQPKSTTRLKSYADKAPVFSMDLPTDYKPYP
jgi:hypothetical protein